MVMEGLKPEVRRHVIADFYQRNSGKGKLHHQAQLMSNVMRKE